MSMAVALAMPAIVLISSMGAHYRQTSNFRQGQVRDYGIIVCMRKNPISIVRGAVGGRRVVLPRRPGPAGKCRGGKS